ncbi:hypothetical protein K7432_009131 [Basidiobolus ranarum]|uniref:Uncharacterized protein n=1 Tax=Basidiobolus ranarum TaxID=34480 RepID=A0ABR2VXX8_9FUNG
MLAPCSKQQFAEDLSSDLVCPFSGHRMDLHKEPTTNGPTKTISGTLLEIVGEEQVEKIVQRFAHYNLTSPSTSTFFLGVNIERLQRMQTLFLVHLLGGRPINTRHMRAAHKRVLDLQDEDFDSVMENLRNAICDLDIEVSIVDRIMELAEFTRDDVLGRNTFIKKAPSSEI